MQISEQIIQVLDALGERFGIAVDWSQQNLLPYIKTLADKYIDWEISTSVVWLITGIIIVGLGVVSLVVGLKMWNDDYTDFDTMGVFLCLGAVSIIVGVLVVGYQIFDIIKCIKFPELQLYEFISEKM